MKTYFYLFLISVIINFIFTVIKSIIIETPFFLLFLKMIIIPSCIYLITYLVMGGLYIILLKVGTLNYIATTIVFLIGYILLLFIIKDELTILQFKKSTGNAYIQIFTLINMGYILKLIINTCK